jgi:hypothetical protein
VTTLLLPTTKLVVIGWLKLAVSGPGVDTDLPDQNDVDQAAAYAAVQTDGFLRIAMAGGSPDPDVPMRQPVVQVESWFAPRPDRTARSPRTSAEQLANRVLNATYDPALMGQVIDLSSVGNYQPARVHTVTALTEPDEVEEDSSNWSRFDVDLLCLWSAA